MKLKKRGTFLSFWYISRATAWLPCFRLTPLQRSPSLYRSPWVWGSTCRPSHTPSPGPSSGDLQRSRTKQWLQWRQQTSKSVEHRVLISASETRPYSTNGCLTTVWR